MRRWTEATDVEADVLYRTYTVPEIRRYQTVVAAQISLAHDQHRDDALADLRAMEAALTRELLRRTAPMSMSGLEAAEKHRQERDRARALACRRAHRESWVVVQRHGNASAFNGYRWTWSDYSCLRCDACGRVWRTKAEYVDAVLDAPNVMRGSEV